MRSIFTYRSHQEKTVPAGRLRKKDPRSLCAAHFGYRKPIESAYDRAARSTITSSINPVRGWKVANRVPRPAAYEAATHR